MGSHRARHRVDQNQSEELATDLLARLADEARPPRTPRKHSTPSPRPTLDPFSTAPFAAHPPRSEEQDGPPSDPAIPLGDHPLGVRPRSPADDSAVEGADGTAEFAAGAIPPPRYPTDHDANSIPAPRFPTGPGASFPLDDTHADTRSPFAVGDAPSGLPDAPRTASDRLAALRRKPVYVAVSATVITAAAAAAAAAGPAALTPPPPSPDRASLAAAAAMDFGPQKPGQPVAPQVAGGAAVLAPGHGSAISPDDSPVLGSSIAAHAAADAKAYADALARQAAQAPAAPKNAPKPAPKNAPKAAPKTAPQPAAVPAAGSGIGARALGLAKGKLGNPYVWGAAGPSAFDCSGLIVWAYKQLGVSLPHSSASLSTMGRPVSKAALQPGDLVFFYSPVSHVGIYAGNGMVLNATQSGEPVQYSQLANLPFHNAVRITI